MAILAVAVHGLGGGCVYLRCFRAYQVRATAGRDIYRPGIVGQQLAFGFSSSAKTKVKNSHRPPVRSVGRDLRRGCGYCYDGLVPLKRMKSRLHPESLLLSGCFFNYAKSMPSVFLFLPVALVVMWWLSKKPTNAGKWAKEQVILPQVTIGDNAVAIQHIRNFQYTTENDFVPNYYDQTFALKDLQRADLIFVPFNRSKHAAHAFISFEFADGEHVAISIEIRKKHNEKYSALRGLLRQYSLMYVIANEADVVKLRTNHRDNKVFLYPLNLGSEQLAKLFLDMARRAQKLQQEPEFYNTFFNACVTNLVWHINRVKKEKIPFHPSIIISGYVDRYFHKLGLFATDLPYQSARQKYYVTDVAQTHDNKIHFSRHLRGG